MVSRVCPGDHDLVAVRGKLIGVYPLRLGLHWGHAIASAVLRLAKSGAERWADREVRRMVKARKEGEDIKAL